MSKHPHEEKMITEQPGPHARPAMKEEMTMTAIKVENYFGGCPQCGKYDGCANVRRSHWFFCKEHKTKWCVGSNLFSSWTEETEEEQRALYYEIGLGSFTEVMPLPCTERDDQNQRQR